MCGSLMSLGRTKWTLSPLFLTTQCLTTDVLHLPSLPPSSRLILQTHQLSCNIRSVSEGTCVTLWKQIGVFLRLRLRLNLGSLNSLKKNRLFDEWRRCKSACHAELQHFAWKVIDVQSFSLLRAADFRLLTSHFCPSFFSSLCTGIR